MVADETVLVTGGSQFVAFVRFVDRLFFNHELHEKHEQDPAKPLLK